MTALPLRLRRAVRRWLPRRDAESRLSKRIGADVPAGFARLSRAPGSVVARLDAGLLLERHRRMFADRVSGSLDDAGLFHWWLPGAEGTPAALCLRIADRLAFLAVLARLADPSWHLAVLMTDGRPQRRSHRVSTPGTVHAIGDVPGLVIWEYVAPSPSSTFVADEQQGVTVLFWSADPDRPGILTTEVANLSATSLSKAQLPVSGGVPTVLTGRQIGSVGFPIDVVYTWVDGQDEQWLAEKLRWSALAVEDRLTDRARDVSRFADHDELRFSLRSIEQYAPWVNHVWIVTSGQRPAWLDPAHDRVSVISHRDIWPNDRGLPTFNSHAIECCLHRIPGLAEHFLYFNDDVIAGRPIRPETFFHANGVGRLFWSKALVDFLDPRPGEIASSTAAKRARALLQRRYDQVTLTRKFFHAPAVLTVSGLQELERTFPDEFAATREAQFRTLDDVVPAGSLYLNWAYLVGRLVPGRIQYAYIEAAAADGPERLRALVTDRRYDVFCLNEGTDPQTPAERIESDRVMREFLAEYLPVAGTFELP